MYESLRPSDLIQEAFAASLDNSLWDGWADKAIKALGGSSGTLFVLDSNRGETKKLISLGWSDVVRDYHEHWYAFDPLVPTMANAKSPLTVLDTDHVNLENRGTAEYMRWQRSEADMDHHMAAGIPLGDGLIAGISIHRTVEAGFTPAEQYRKLRAMLPQVSHAMQLSFRNNQMLQQAFWDGLVTQRDHHAIVLLDECGAIIRATSVVHELVNTDDGLRILGGRMRARDRNSDSALSAMVSRAIASSNPMAGAIKIARRDGRLPYILTAFPLLRAHRALAPLDAAALIRIIDPNSPFVNSSSIYREAFDFSPRENELALLLLRGHSVESAAATLAIGMPTARVHLRRLLNKTGTGRQIDLVRLLSRLA